jgi:hypothetical protein
VEDKTKAQHLSESSLLLQFFVMLPLPVYQVAPVRLQFLHHVFLKHLHRIAFLNDCLYGMSLDPHAMLTRELQSTDSFCLHVT